MRKIFFEPGMIAFTKHFVQDESAGTQVLYHSEMQLWPLFEEWIRGGVKKDFLLVTSRPAELFNTFAKHFRTIEAAGGVVENPDGELLLIYRRGKWDLPKGKIDKGEKKVAAAIREVEEETGIGRLTVTKTLQPTYHIYQEKDQSWILKKTYWFAMKTPQRNKARPQLEEEITRAEWVSQKTAVELSHQTFRSIKAVIGSFLIK